MFDRESRQRLKEELKGLFPLFRYLVLQTETHAFCLALACAALIGFYPACLVLLTVLKHLLGWDAAYDVLLETLGTTYPAPLREDFLVQNLEVTLNDFGQRTRVSSLFWVLLGAAGVFIPLETAFNRLWKVTEDRPYWLNQIVGFALALACVVLAVLFVSISTALRYVVGFFPVDLVQRTLEYIIIRVTTTCFFIVTIFAFYKFLPNKKISASKVLPAAILAGTMAELVRVVYVWVLPSLNLFATQGPYVVSVSFVLLVYFETFVVLGGAFLASQSDQYPWMGFLRTRSNLPSA